MQDVSFRRASVEDAPAIAALVNACYRGDSSRRGWTSEADLLDGTRTDLDEIRDLVSQPDSMILACQQYGKVVGSVHLKLQGSSCYVGMLVVEPELQRVGLGKHILQTAEQVARRTWGVRRMTMTVVSVRHELISYYERRGYRRTGNQEPFKEDVRHGVPRTGGLMFAWLEKDLGAPRGTPDALVDP